MRLRTIFFDFNSYFASVEQQLRPELRGKPVGVVPMMAETTCCIAASYEAKAYGVKTGTGVREARQLCPGIQFVEARHSRYVRFHHEIVRCIESCLHVSHVHSIDEMSCALMGKEREPENAVRIAREVKAALCRDVGECLTCSAGIAPNAWLAKIASDMQKPDGLTVILPQELPGRIYPLKLTDLPGIGSRMERRLHAKGVFTVERLCAATELRLAELFQSKVLGRLWWHQLRGDDVGIRPTVHRSVGHSRVLSPDLRTGPEARKMTACMLHRAAERMRRMGYWARSLTLSVSFMDAPSWHARAVMEPTRDTLSFVQAFDGLWSACPAHKPLKVGVVLGDMLPAAVVAPSLFEPLRHRDRLATAMDKLNGKFGPHSVYFADMHGAQRTVPVKVAFTHIPDSYECQQEEEAEWA